MHAPTAMNRLDRVSGARAARPVERNHILAALPIAEREAMAPQLSRTRLVQDQTLFEVRGPVEYVYFMEHGILSLTAEFSGRRPGMQVGMIGPEGFGGFSAVFGAGAVSMCQVNVQMPGTALRMQASAFRVWQERSSAFNAACLGHVRTLMAQFAQNAACNGAHTLLNRCANWLLMVHQRSAGLDFLLTHEYLATTLGVRRSGVTVALAMLRDAGVIEHGRGRIRVVDQAQLQDLSCGCYRLVHDETVPPRVELSCAAVEEPVQPMQPAVAADLPIAAHAFFGARLPSNPG